jgi:outer membrane lipoprotein-sorting protein
MKRTNLPALAFLLLLNVVVGCSQPDAPAVGAAMMKEDAKMKNGEAMMMKDGAMMKDDKMMKEDGK